MSKPIEISNEQIKEVLKPIVEYLYILDKYSEEEAFRYFTKTGKTHQRLINIFQDLFEKELIAQKTFDSIIRDIKENKD